jgi:hypothetical protein
MVACMLQIEFLDNPAVARWLVEDVNSHTVRERIADAIAKEIVAYAMSVKP